VITTLLVAAALTALADTRPGGHNSPADDWVAIGLGVAVIRLVYRQIRRRRRRLSRDTP
jgi:hypothetical protein